MFCEKCIFETRETSKSTTKEPNFQVRCRKLEMENMDWNIYNRKGEIHALSVFKQLFAVGKFQIDAFEFPLVLPHY